MRANFRHMLQKAGIDPRVLGHNIEVLRQSKRISEQEYQVYLAHLNQMFGTKLLPIELEQGRTMLVQRLLAAGAESGGPNKALLELLTNPQALAAAERQIEQRLREDRENQARRRGAP